MEVPSARTRDRGLILAAVAFGVALLAYAIAANRNPAHLWYMLDLQVYRAGGAAARHGTGLYDLRYQLNLPFTYPPFAAAIFEPLSLLGLNTLKLLLTGGSIVALVCSVGLAVRASAPTWPRARRRKITLAVSAAALWLEPVQQTLHFGQVNIVLMAVVLADLLQPDEHRAKGVGVGVAAGLKLTPLIFVVYLLLTRRFRATATAVGAFFGTVLLGAIALPGESRQFWIDHLFLDSGRIGGLQNAPNQSLQGVLARLAHGVDASAVYWRPLVVLVAAIGLTLATRAYRRSSEITGVLVCALTGLLISPVSWSHHWVYAAPAVGVAVVFARTHHDRVAWSLTGIGVLLLAAWPVSQTGGEGFVPLGLIWSQPRYDRREYGWQGMHLILGNMDFLVGLVALVGAWVVLRPDVSRSRSRTGAPGPKWSARDGWSGTGCAGPESPHRRSGSSGRAPAPPDMTSP